MYLEVYPDIIFILNFLIDFILIYLVKKVNRKKSKFIRMTLAAVIGAFSAVVVSIFPWMHVLIRFLIMNIAASVLMIIIAFGRLKIMDTLKQVVVLDLITYFVGGLMNSIYYHTDFRLYLINLGNGIVFSNISWKFVGIALLITAPVIVLGLLFLRWYKKIAPTTFDVELVLNDRSVHTKGLMDTGNCLYDPIYKRPVMVMENTLMGELLSPELYRDIEEAKRYLEGNELDTSKWDINPDNILRLRFIPYRSVGKSGMLLGIRLDKVMINTGKETICNEKVTAAFCDNRLSTKDDYHVILHKELL